MLTPEPILAWT